MEHLMTHGFFHFVCGATCDDNDQTRLLRTWSLGPQRSGKSSGVPVKFYLGPSGPLKLGELPCVSMEHPAKFAWGPCKSTWWAPWPLTIYIYREPCQIQIHLSILLLTYNPFNIMIKWHKYPLTLGPVIKMKQLWEIYWPYEFQQNCEQQIKQNVSKHDHNEQITQNLMLDYHSMLII